METLPSSTSQGSSPKARQIRWIVVGDSPTRLASSRLDQCVAPAGTSSKVLTTTSSICASVIVRGTPGRGSSLSPANRAVMNRFRHRPTVSRVIPSSAATAMLLLPSAHISTMRARWAKPCAVLRRLAHPSSVRRSASVSTSGSLGLPAIPPSERRTQDRDTRRAGHRRGPGAEPGNRCPTTGQRKAPDDPGLGRLDRLRAVCSRDHRRSRPDGGAAQPRGRRDPPGRSGLGPVRLLSARQRLRHRRRTDLRARR